MQCGVWCLVGACAREGSGGGKGAGRERAGEGEGRGGGSIAMGECRHMMEEAPRHSGLGCGEVWMGDRASRKSSRHNAGGREAGAATEEVLEMDCCGCLKACAHGRVSVE